MTNVTLKPQRRIGRKLHIDAAKKMASRYLFDLKLTCELIAMTGAIRREEEYVRSIEILCAPKNDKHVDLFGEIETSERSREFMQRAGRIGRLLAGTRSGSFMKFRLEAEDLLVELYITTPEEFYLKLAMTTGPAIFTDVKIKDAIRSKGYVPTNKGFRHISETYFQNGKYWAVKSARSGIPSFDTEMEVFDWLGMEFIAPQLRGKPSIK